MKIRNLIYKAVMVMAIAFGFSLTANAQAILGTNTNGPQSVALNYTVSPTVTITVDQSSLTWTDGNNAPTFHITTAWNLNSSYHTINGTMYFSSADALSDGNGDNILNTQIQAAVNGGSPAVFNNSDYFSGGFGLPYHTISLNGAYSGSVTDAVVLSIVNPGQVVPSSYAGTLYIASYEQ